MRRSRSSLLNCRAEKRRARPVGRMCVRQTKAGAQQPARVLNPTGGTAHGHATATCAAPRTLRPAWLPRRGWQRRRRRRRRLERGAGRRPALLRASVERGPGRPAHQLDRLVVEQRVGGLGPLGIVQPVQLAVGAGRAEGSGIQGSHASEAAGRGRSAPGVCTPGMQQGRSMVCGGLAAGPKGAARTARCRPRQGASGDRAQLVPGTTVHGAAHRRYLPRHSVSQMVIGM